MANLRLISVSVIDGSNITAKFSDLLNENINIANIVFDTQTPGVPTPSIIDVEIFQDTINIKTQPLTPLAAYYIIFQSSPDVLFKSLNGNSILLNDGITNKQLILGPLDASNPIKEYLVNFLRDNVYDLDEPSLISKYLKGLSIVLSKSLYDIKQSKNENYLSFTVVDENKTRGSGAFDRLNEEGAYEVLRVGKTKTGGNLNSNTQIISFPSYKISLQSTNNTEDITLSSIDKIGTFNLNSFTFNLSKKFPIVLNSVIFVYNSALISYKYDIEKYGYQLLNSSYDPNFAFTYFQLTDNQIKLNDKILNDPLFSTENIANIIISYQYKDTGKIIDPNSLIIDTVLPSGREVVPPIENIFALKHAPITTKLDIIGSIGDISFIDPNALQNSNALHPAFLYEIKFRLDYLPSRPGEYSIDYNTGNVYVYGNDNSQTGTGAFPPLAVYYYRYVFKNEVDYVYDKDLFDLVSLPNGSLLNSSANIIYTYEQVLAEDVDYKASTHIEVLNERIENRLIALNAIQPLNFPITNVFRIFNETSGEIYKILRWNDNKIYFTYNKAPNIEVLQGERASFQDVPNEILFVSASSIVSPYSNIFKMYLNNNNIIAASEDSIGSSINTSVKFSNINIFSQEMYYDNNLTEVQNNSILLSDGYYQIDYVNGVVWCLVPSDQNFSIGTVSYKRGYIAPQNPHIITVDDIYYKSNILNKKIKSFNYTNFSDGSILPSSFDFSNETFLMNNATLPYQILNGQVGAIINATFTPGLTYDINFVRGLYEHQDLLNNKSPLNFTSISTNGNNISVSPSSFKEYHTVQFDGTNYYIFANTGLFYKSPSINFTYSIKRLSDNAQLWDSGGTIILGNPFKLILSGINVPNVGDSVLLEYSYTIIDLSRIIVDYNKGDYYIDYSYLADEIIISYEYGDNVLDFRQSSALNIGDNYFVSYKVGALREGLLQNFGTLINIPILNNLDVSFERERYRDALMAALQSFTAGPTVASMSNIVNTIVHTPPEIIESAFQNWSLGNSLLNLEPIKTTGEFSLIPGKYGNGVLLNSPGQTIKFPAVSNLRLEQGILSSWIIPDWDGIDNQSDLFITIYKNGTLINPNQIFIGPAGYHPKSDGYVNLKLNTLEDNVLGKPNKSKDGVFIYYSTDAGGKFNRWFIDVSDGYADGYDIKNYKISIKTNGKFYDVKSNQIVQPTSDKIFSGTNNVDYTITGTNQIDQGITFLADNHHYLFDFAKNEGSNRFSIYKDESGYLNFKVIDKNKNAFSISSDISSWKRGEQHYISTSWALNTINGRDEMHLFVDGLEVPNIIKYKTKVSPYLHEKFRTINPEEIVGVITNPIVSSIDLITTSGSNTVSSSLNFDAYGILPGNTLYVEEVGFSNAVYTILNVNGNILTLSMNMPVSMTDAKFSINKVSFDVLTDIDLYKNIAVSLLHSSISGNDLSTTINNSTVASSINFTSQNVEPGYIIRIVGIGFTSHYTILSVNGNSLILDDIMPSTNTSLTFYIYPNIEEEIPGVRALRPAYEISRNDGPILTVKDKAFANDIVLIRTLGLNIRTVDKKYYHWGNTSNLIMTRLPAPSLLDDVNITHIILDGYNFTSSSTILTDQPSISDNGRTLSVYISGDNIDYTFPLTVVINGNITETLTFTKNDTKLTLNKFKTISNVNVSCVPIDGYKKCGVISIKEAHTITTAENSNSVPVIRYSYQMLSGNSLTGIGNIITDLNRTFSFQDVGNYINISYPPVAAGQYKITDISQDLHSLTISNSLPTFYTGVYEILNVSTFRSGLQNGFFTFEEASMPGQPYILVQGLYEFKYNTYLSIPLELDRLYAYVGTDFKGNNLINSIVDELQILSENITDTRIGETSLSNQKTITKDFNSLKSLTSTISTLILIHFDTFPFVNDTDFYITASNSFIQSSLSVNDNFGKSILFTNIPLVIDNTGILNNKKEGSIEFWVNPLYDTSNDPNYRFYFDATSIVSEKLVSINNSTVKVAGRISNILNVKLLVGNQNIDYFAGGHIDPDNQTIYLNKALPNQNTPIIVNYIPTGVNGDRISIYKDPAGEINFDVRASGTDYKISAPVYWTKNSWHRLKATFKVNSGLGSDEIKFFIDGYETGQILFGNNFISGQAQVVGSSYVSQSQIKSSIVFKDTINEIIIGSDYTRTKGAYALIDNLRISNISRPQFFPFGESIDVNYSTNLDIVFPVTEDLYTTLLLDFETVVFKNTDFTNLKNKKTGLFDFSINIFDKFGIVNDSAKVKQVLETLIDILKPANSKVFIKYIE